jgi:hypothetical protein
VKYMPLTAILSWLCERFPIFVTMICGSIGLIIIPQVVLWTRDLDRGLQAGMSLLALLLTLAGVIESQVIEEIVSRYRDIRELFQLS